MRHCVISEGGSGKCRVGDARLALGPVPPHPMHRVYFRRDANDRAEQLPDSTLRVEGYRNWRGWPFLTVAYHRSRFWVDEQE